MTMFHSYLQTIDANLLKTRHQNPQYLECMIELKCIFKILPKDVLTNFDFKVFDPLLMAEYESNDAELKHELKKLVDILKARKSGTFFINESTLLKRFFGSEDSNVYEKLLTLKKNGGVVLKRYVDYFAYWLKAVSPKGNHSDTLLVMFVAQIHEEYRKLLSLNVALWLKVNPKEKVKLRFSGPFDRVFKDEKRSPNPKFTAEKLTAMTCFAFGKPINEKSVYDLVRARAKDLRETYQDDV